MQNWRQAIRTPTPYRVGNSAIRMQTKFVYSVAIGGVVILTLLYLLLPRTRYGMHMTNDEPGYSSDLGHGHYNKLVSAHKYNSTYPLTPVKVIKNKIVYKIALITDLDEKSRSKTDNVWLSYMKTGKLTYDLKNRNVHIEWDRNYTTLTSSFSYNGRGMELSELIVFDGRLLTVDDRTGIILEIENGAVIPWVFLNDGDGRQSKGFKSEWAAVKDNELYVGGLGKEWTSKDGELLNLYPQWVKIITPSGEVRHVDWHLNYNAMRNAVNIYYPGYMIHESACWSNLHDNWFFLPRRASRYRYDEKQDERQGSNLLFRCSEDFKNIQVTAVGKIIPTRGFSSFKFIPDSQDGVIVAIKSEEIDGKIASYIMAFDVNGEILLPEIKIDNFKFEGLEFI